MRIAVITQPDSMVIPRNVSLLTNSEEIELTSILVLDVKGALSNKRGYFLRGFGPMQMGKMAFRLVWEKLHAALGKRNGSLKSIAKREKADYKVVSKLHSRENIEYLRSLDLDVIVSYSAPIVFKESLLTIPKSGCINLHCSRLPKFAGLLPSFWVLYHRDSVAGATVHYMDDKIDNGGILGQVELPLKGSESMLDVIRMTKEAGGRLMLDVLKSIQASNITTLPNNPEDGSYFTWPTIEEMKEFRRRGGRLV